MLLLILARLLHSTSFIYHIFLFLLIYPESTYEIIYSESIDYKLIELNGIHRLQNHGLCGVLNFMYLKRSPLRINFVLAYFIISDSINLSIRGTLTSFLKDVLINCINIYKIKSCLPWSLLFVFPDIYCIRILNRRKSDVPIVWKLTI